MGWVRGSHNGRRQVGFEMHLRQNKVFQDHFNVFFNGKPGWRGPTQPAYWETPLFFLKPPLNPPPPLIGGRNLKAPPPGATVACYDLV